MISTRRFLARPWGVSFGARRSDSPRPSARMRPGATRTARSLATDSARALESSQFDGKRSVRIGALSV